ncbi:MAG: Fic family protein [Candidatus ainarchaeum sp.]|nr:Fic family protein [Candidatus ainarchaeum sp.]
MVSIIKKENNGEKYNYFVKKFSFLGKSYQISKYIGKKPFVSKEEYLIENLENLTKCEFDLKKPFFPKDLIYFNKLIDKIEYDSIKLNNLIEGKQKQIFIESKLLEEFVFNSNNIEGSKLPKSELEKIFENKKIDHLNKNEILEAKNSIKAYDYLKNDFSFNIRSIKKLYQILTNGLVMETGDKYPTGFRKVPLVVGNESTMDPEKISDELKSLLTWYKLNKNSYPLKLAFDFHLYYESIHPFRDGNGRTGRLIMNKILLKNNYPLMIVFKDNKQAYFNSIKQAREGKTINYYQFMLLQQKKSYDFIENLLK